ncbi:MAG TPA: glycosyltransferase family 1 protein, partial [Acidimicrobiales bacterium]|nr:glycosyltransferase family 1 protein [Acidimicrobiales bacterium]
PGRRPARLVWEQLRLPSLLAGTVPAPQVHHAPHYTMPERARLPMVVTIHDLTFLDHPEWHERTKVPFFRRAIGVAARRADVLVCVSEVTATRLRERCAPAGEVTVVPHGVDHERFRAQEPDPGADAAMLAALGIRPPYVLFLGTLEPRKAVPTLVAAFDALAPRHAELALVLAGGRGWGTEAIDAALAAAGHADRVVRTGYVEDAAVPALLRSAAVVAYPAVEEGFGLPALEALACGAPLVTTAGTAMAEAAAGAALLVVPGSAGELAEALDEALAGGPAVEERRRLGLDRAARFTWAASAAGHVAAYRRALATASPGGRAGGR